MPRAYLQGRRVDTDIQLACDSRGPGRSRPTSSSGCRSIRAAIAFRVMSDGAGTFIRKSRARCSSRTSRAPA